MKQKITAFYRAFLMSAAVLLCPLILIYGIITADLNTKKIYFNRDIDLVELSDGEVRVLGKTVPEKYLSWTKYPTLVFRVILPKVYKTALDISVSADNEILKVLTKNKTV